VIHDDIAENVQAFHGPYNVEVLKPDHIALMHLPIRLEGDAPGKIDQVRTS